MLKRTSRPIVAFVSLMLFLVTGQVSVQGYVWCLGEDGHAALEYAENNSCGAEPEARQQDCHDEENALSDLGQDEHCGPCLDIPATLEVTSFHDKYQKNLQAPPGLPITAQSLSSLAFSQALSTNQLAQPPPRVSQSLIAHRTVVLLS